MKIKDIFICALSALLLCSCANSTNSSEISETVETEPTTTTETSVTEETAAETSAVQTVEPEIITEFFMTLTLTAMKKRSNSTPSQLLSAMTARGTK